MSSVTRPWPGADGLGPGVPAALFGAAYRAGRVAELDWACRAAAFTEAVRGGLGPPLTLFVNAELVSLGVACPEDLRPAIELGRSNLRVVVEVTERAVAGDPARLLATVAQARQAGWGPPLTTSVPRRPAWPCSPSSAPI